jgi:hypothetical protein
MSATTAAYKDEREGGFNTSCREIQAGQGLAWPFLAQVRRWANTTPVVAKT